MKQKNVLPIIVLLIILVIISFSGLYYYRHTIISDGVVNDNNWAGFGGKLVYQIENVIEDSQSLFIDGWCFVEGQAVSDKSPIPTMRLVLADLNDYSKLRYYVSDYGINRPDVNDYYSCEVDYIKCGFEVKIPLNQLDLENTIYELLIQQNDRYGIIVRTGIYLINGKIAFDYPGLHKEIDVRGTDLEKVVKNGIIRASWDDEGLYVYQYKGKMYWITDQQCDLNNGYIEYQVGTTQPEKISSGYSNNLYKFDNKRFLFEDYEITNSINSGKYRVAVQEIPNYYAITNFYTGFITSDEEVVGVVYCPLFNSLFQSY